MQVSGHKPRARNLCNSYSYIIGHCSLLVLFMCVYMLRFNFFIGSLPDFLDSLGEDKSTLKPIIFHNSSNPVIRLWSLTPNRPSSGHTCNNMASKQVICIQLCRSYVYEHCILNPKLDTISKCTIRGFCFVCVDAIDALRPCQPILCQNIRVYYIWKDLWAHDVDLWNVQLFSGILCEKIKGDG